MARGGMHIILKYVQRQALRQGDALPDSALLERFVSSRDEAAFELLVWRHASLVLNVCQRLLRNQHDVEDAFQAAFAALACKARSIRTANSVAPWLHKVAFRAALRLRGRQRRTVALTPGSEPLAAPNDEPDRRDLRHALDAAIQKLPAKYRDAFVLCCLEGLTHGEAAVRLGCPEGTIHSRLATAKERLRRGLERRGITLSGTGLAFEFSVGQSGNAPTVQLIHETLTTAFAVSGGSVGATVAKSSVLSLTRGVLLTMWIQTNAIPAMIAVTLGLVGIGVAGFQNKNSAADNGDAVAQHEPGKQNADAATNPAAKAPSQPALPKNTTELARLTEELNTALRELEDERAKTQKDCQDRQATLSNDLLKSATQEELQGMVDTHRLAREKKSLTSLEEEEIVLSKDLRKAAAVLPLNSPEPPLSRQLNEVRKAIKEKTDLVVRMERTAKELQTNIRMQRDPIIRMLDRERENWLHLQAHFERRAEQLRSKAEALNLMSKFPDLEQIRSQDARSADLHRLENKLDQMLHGLEELKKRIDKP